MRHRDLGRLDGPLLLFGGPYSNRQAFEALLAEAAARGIGAERMICTGDVVAYCARPAETVAAVRALGCAVVAGNCEVQLAANADGCGCGFEDGTACDLLSAGWYSYARRAVDGAARDWMGDLPDIVSFTHHGRRYAVIHGGVTDIARFVWPVSPEAVFADEVAAIAAAIGPVDAVIAGHCGVAFERSVAGVRWINAGVIGMPPNDGVPATRFATLQGGRARIETLVYDHAAAHADMQASGLTQGYHQALLSGFWPSEEVLPPDMRRRQSLAIG